MIANVKEGDEVVNAKERGGIVNVEELKEQTGIQTIILHNR